jgi:hypothetical protein
MEVQLVRHASDGIGHAVLTGEKRKEEIHASK